MKKLMLVFVLLSFIPSLSGCDAARLLRAAFDPEYNIRTRKPIKVPLTKEDKELLEQIALGMSNVTRKESEKAGIELPHCFTVEKKIQLDKENGVEIKVIFRWDKHIHQFEVAKADKFIRPAITPTAEDYDMVRNIAEKMKEKARQFPTGRMVPVKIDRGPYVTVYAYLMWNGTDFEIKMIERRVYGGARSRITLR